MARIFVELGQLASGEYVFDRNRSHLHGPVADVLCEVLAKIDSLERELIVAEVDLGRIVGKSTCVVTRPTDEIVYKVRPGRKGPTRFVLGREPVDSSSVVVVLKLDEYSDTYVCITAYIGTHSEPEPWDEFATDKSKPFWETHAMIWDVTDDD